MLSDNAPAGQALRKVVQSPEQPCRVGVVVHPADAGSSGLLVSREAAAEFPGADVAFLRLYLSLERQDRRHLVGAENRIVETVVGAELSHDSARQGAPGC